jgi:hypothetical protein
MIVIYDDKSGHGQARISHTLLLRGEVCEKCGLDGL